LIWFFLPAGLVISNDIFAYMWGFFFGRTPLIQLSPKKTWEGFIGAMFSTLICGFVITYFLAQLPWLICPKVDFLEHPVNCEPSDIFISRPYEVPQWLGDLLSLVRIPHPAYVELFPIQFHSLALAIFASIIAPFGGFFASGFKRAFKIKDFADTIPGHGGIVDRMDCQVLMAVFSWVYFTTFVNKAAGAVDVANLFNSIALLTPDDQVILFKKLQKLLDSKGLLSVLT